MDIDKRISFGGAIKSVGNNLIEGYLIRFTDENTRDLTGEYFSDQTDLHIADGYPIKGAPVLFNHALDGNKFTNPYGVKRIGTITDVKVDDVGVWVQALIEEQDQYMQSVMQAIESGRLGMGWSSGALPQSVQVDDHKHIKSWAVIEGSMTPTPAMPFQTSIQTLKSLRESQELDLTVNLPEVDSDKVEQHTVTPNDEIPVTKSSHSKGALKMDTLARVKELLNELVGLLAEEEMGEPSAEEQAVMTMAGEEELAKANVPADAVLPEELVKSIFGKMLDARDKRRASFKSVLNGRKASAPVEFATKPVSQKSERIILTDERLDHMSANDMQFAYLTMAGRYKNVPNMNPEQVVTPEFYRAMAVKSAKSVSQYARPEDQYAAIKAMPFKADEIDATNLTNFGAEWVGTLWSSSLWEKARNRQIYKELIAAGMVEQEIPQGVSTVNIPTESSDPTVYSYPELNDLHTDNYPPVQILTTPIGTGYVALTASPIGAASAYTVLLEEDSIIPVAAQFNRQMSITLQEHIEKLMVNGDTATGANTNINLIDGTPGTTTSRPYYLAANGFLKYPLVTNTALSRDGAALSIDDYLQTIALFAPEFGSQPEKIVFLIDHYTYLATLNLTELKTAEVAGGRGFATMISGVIDAAFGSKVVRSGFMGKANTAGKISATPGNNTKGRIAAIYAPYWAFGFKRQIKLETDYSALAQTTTVVGTLRMGMVARGADAAAISYNLTV